ncbi:hypothetical protein EHT87_16675 [Larkinella knui]|uniref:Uncharacterized protein n=1 Tax=Larkinella knui TaxID=2025310 RepID=A0A3P1CKN7_9BACT|nr:hypothetical protein EHT87_16675 [Larkinella knui]
MKIIINCLRTGINLQNRSCGQQKAGIVRVYIPPDANCPFSVMDHCLPSRHYGHVIVAGKHRLIFRF